MLNIIWLAMIIISIIAATIHGTIPEVVNSVTSSAKFAFELALNMAGIMAFWLGLMKIAEDAKLIDAIARLLQPLMRWLFPEVPKDHPAMGSMILNMAANMLGLNNAATPFGLKAMKELEKLNKLPGTATDAMCTFLAINTSSIQLIPTTTIAMLAAGGAIAPSNIVISALLATTCSTIAGLIAVKSLAKMKHFQVQAEES